MPAMNMFWIVLHFNSKKLFFSCFFVIVEQLFICFCCCLCFMNLFFFYFYLFSFIY